MSLFLFIKNAGAKVFGIGKTVVEESAEALAIKRKAEAKAAVNLKEVIIELQLKVTDLDIYIEYDLATISGVAFNQETKEKVVLVVGNSKGIASVDDQMTVNHVEPEAMFHTVSKGDTLDNIAKTYYGNAMMYPEIFEANKPMLKSPDLIYLGQVIRIPKLEK